MVIKVLTIVMIAPERWAEVVCSQLLLFCVSPDF
jgi:hypothetical protein